MAEGDTFAISGLVRKRAEIAGHVVEMENRLAQARADLGHLDGVIRLLDPTYRPEAIRPKRRPSQYEAWFGPGELGRLALGVLRRRSTIVERLDLGPRLVAWRLKRD